MFKPFLSLARPLATIAAFSIIAPAIVSFSSPASASSRAQSAVAHLQSPSSITAQSTSYAFSKLDDPQDLTFNQLLGINNGGKIAGYFGNGVTNPNKGYRIEPPYTTFTNENFPGSTQTQVTCVNNGPGQSAGFWVDSHGNQFGFTHSTAGGFKSYRDPNAGTATGQITNILGINDNNLAVGFWTNPNASVGGPHGFELNLATGKFTEIDVRGATSTSVTAINDKNDIVGFYTTAGATYGFLLKNGVFYSFSFPVGNTTEPLGINDNDEIVGSYNVGTAQYGFTITNPLDFASYQTIVDPDGVTGSTAMTVVNGVNDKGQLVGFYLDSNGNTDGFLATPH
jgi:hypothetical protein